MAARSPALLVPIISLPVVWALRIRSPPPVCFISISPSTREVRLTVEDAALLLSIVILLSAVAVRSVVEVSISMSLVPVAVLSPAERTMVPPVRSVVPSLSSQILPLFEVMAAVPVVVASAIVISLSAVIVISPVPVFIVVPVS